MTAVNATGVLSVASRTRRLVAPGETQRMAHGDVLILDAYNSPPRLEADCWEDEVRRVLAAVKPRAARAASARSGEKKASA